MDLLMVIQTFRRCPAELMWAEVVFFLPVVNEAGALLCRVGQREHNIFLRAKRTHP